jgi:hypothetical protein
MVWAFRLTSHHEPIPQRPQLGADVDGKLRLTRTGLPDLCQNARRPRLPLVEDGQLDREFRPCDAGAFGGLARR